MSYQHGVGILQLKVPQDFSSYARTQPVKGVGGFVIVELTGADSLLQPKFTQNNGNSKKRNNFFIKKYLFFETSVKNIRNL